MNYILYDTIECFKNKCFHSFECRCVYDFQLLYMENNEEVLFTIDIGYMKFRSHFYGLKKLR